MAVISAIVLAAGTSTRFGATKQLEIVRGKTLVQHTVDAASPLVDEVIVVLGHDAGAVGSSLELPANARTVRNPRYAEGQSSSLTAGLAACAPGSEAAVVLLGDQPGIRVDHVRTLVTAFADTRAEVLRLRFRDGPGPALIARTAWPELQALTGDIGARAILDADPERIRWVDVDEDRPPDVDAPGDLERT